MVTKKFFNLLDLPVQELVCAYALSFCNSNTLVKIVKTPDNLSTVVLACKRILWRRPRVQFLGRLLFLDYFETSRVLYEVTNRAALFLESAYHTIAGDMTSIAPNYKDFKLTIFRLHWTSDEYPPPTLHKFIVEDLSATGHGTSQTKYYSSVYSTIILVQRYPGQYYGDPDSPTPRIDFVSREPQKLFRALANCDYMQHFKIRRCKKLSMHDVSCSVWQKKITGYKYKIPYKKPGDKFFDEKINKFVF